MKTINFLAMLLIAAMLFSSCKKEDEGTPKQMTKTHTFSLNLIGTAGVKGELPASQIKLNDIIGIDPAKNLENAEMQLANSYIEVSGLSQIDAPEGEAVVLNNFTIKVGTRPGVDLGTCSTDPQGTNEFAADIRQSTNQMIGIVQNIFTDISSGSKSSTITVSFTPNISITSADNVQLKISIGGTYHYVVFD
ncbi:MAG: hypothetical protein K0B11_00380 [Mariniphaga sp.]|nr:hypothetical protein [Mariniphaga sp.]